MSEQMNINDYAFYMSQEFAAVLPIYRLTPTQRDLWDFMLGNMQRGGHVLATLEEIGEWLGTDPANLSKAMKYLRERGMVWRVRSGTYQVNPRIAFKGTVDEWNRALQQIPEDVPDVIAPKYQRRPPRRPLAATPSAA